MPERVLMRLPQGVVLVDSELRIDHANPAAERFDYLYSEDELREWVPRLRELAGETQTVYAMFNNNGRSAMPSPPMPEAIENEKDGFVAQAPTNAQMLKRLL